VLEEGDLLLTLRQDVLQCSLSRGTALLVGFYRRTFGRIRLNLECFLFGDIGVLRTQIN
jgi:hypothetical protein